MLISVPEVERVIMSPFLYDFPSISAVHSVIRSIAVSHSGTEYESVELLSNRISKRDTREKVFATPCIPSYSQAITRIFHPGKILSGIEVLESA